jgi:cytochrome c553
MLGVATGPALAQDAPKGDAAAAKSKISMCIGCHGVVGYRTAYPDVYQVPKIGGQSPAYIVKALEAYKSGDRPHPSMQGVARSLSAKDMADLAAYYGEATK